MNIQAQRTTPLVLTVIIALLPVLLIASAVRTYRQLEDQRAVYLRGRVAAVAGRLEAMPAGLPEDQWIDALSEEEPHLVDLLIYDRASSPAELSGLWEGRELFRTGKTIAEGQPCYRGYVPFHGPQGLRIARIDVAEEASEFLVAHARHHLVLVGLGGVTILILTFVAARFAMRAAIAERRQLELQHLAHIGQMSAALAHEIRNPLGTIKGFAQLLREKTGDAHAALLTPIVSESMRLERLVKDLLLYGRPAQALLQVVDSEQIEAMVRMHASQLLDAKEARLETSVSPLKLETDLSLLEQILLNLLRNAADAMMGRTESVVRFELDGGEDGVILRMRDNGPGIDAAGAARLFEPFHTTKASGTGLGLCISRKLAEALGGQLQIANQPGGGVMAEVRLPKKRTPAAS